jgi:flagellar assembly protein FliH
MSWSDPEPQAPAHNAFRAGLSIVGSTASGGLRNRAADGADRSDRQDGPEPGFITSLPFGNVGNQNQGSERPRLGGLGQNISQLLEQHFEQLEGQRDASPEVPVGKIRPVVFSAFGAEEAAAAAAEAEAAEAARQAAEIELVEAEPAPPPIDYEAIKAEAWSEGFQQGYDEGRRLAAEEQKDTTIRLGALLHDIVADNEGFVRSMENDIVELVLAVAEKVVGREARTDPQIIVSVVRSALNEIHDASEVRIRAHPDDVAILEPRWQEMLPRRVAERSELLADELVERGGVVVETQIGYVDSQIKTRLQQVINTFQAVLDGEPV